MTADRAWALAARIVLLAAVAYVVFLLFFALQQVLLQILLATIIATGLRPLVDRLRRQGFSRVVSVLLIYALLVILLVLIGVVMVPPVVEQIETVVQNAPRYGDIAVDLLQGLSQRFPFLPPLDEQLATQVRNIGSQFGAIASQAAVVARFAVGIFSGAFSIFLILLITLYLIVDGERIRDYFLSFLPLERQANLRRVLDRAGERMGGWLMGQVALSGAVGAVSYLGLVLLGINSAALLALLAAIGEAIPVVGPILSAVPAVIVGFMQSTWQGIAVLVLYLAIQQLENNILVPKIMERAVALHPLAVVVALLIGGELLGIVGMIISVPVAAALAVILGELRHVEAEAPPPAAEVDRRLVEADVGQHPEPVKG